MLERYVVKTKLAGTYSEHFTIADTYHDDIPVEVYSVRRKAHRRVEELNRQSHRCTARDFNR